MKKTLITLTIILFSCTEKKQLNSTFEKITFENKDLDSNFRKIIIDYQKTFPVKNPKKGNIYVYVAAFSKEKNDTIFTIIRTSAGILRKNKNIYGLYKDNELGNFVIYDESRLGSSQIKIYKKELPDSLIWKEVDFPEIITPESKFKIVNKVPKFVRTDTIWTDWD
ncbi:hypothetical protein [Flavobacterium luminosum]|uniref:Lipoprotein n=1 Tax=Flavobacterium luminosum TaxID=2949086 RepID=A0ABT0TRD1_9FLAO|nr:hypothetical protein [Flavobacterium sp. HXWNR70]MCL9810069.1 hypothetical protein [Flavobacterium sp. HXWNR70]